MRQSLHPKSSRTRRWVYTAIIVAAAGGLAWWGSHTKGQQHELIRSNILTLVDSMVDGETVTWQYDWAAPNVARPVMLRLRELALSIPDGASEFLEITIAPQGLAPFERGGATHQALLSLDGQPKLGLMFEVGSADDDILIVGYWEPAQNSGG